VGVSLSYTIEKLIKSRTKVLLGKLSHRNIILNHKTVEKTLLCVIYDISINKLAASPGMVEAKCCLFGHRLFKSLDHTALFGCCRMFSLLNSGFCDLH